MYSRKNMINTVDLFVFLINVIIMIMIKLGQRR